MLILTRKKDESIIVGSDIEITVTRIQRHRVSLGIAAPKEVLIYRKELCNQSQEQKTVKNTRSQSKK